MFYSAKEYLPQFKNISFSRRHIFPELEALTSQLQFLKLQSWTKMNTVVHHVKRSHNMFVPLLGITISVTKHVSEDLKYSKQS